MRKLIVLFVLLIVLTMLFMSSGQTYEQQSLVPELEKWLPGKPLESLLATLEIPYWGIQSFDCRTRVLCLRRVLHSKRRALFHFWFDGHRDVRRFAKMALP